jgi:hypothetical protein
LIGAPSGWIPENAGLTETGKILVEFLISHGKDMKIGMYFASVVNNTIVCIDWTIPFR